MVLSFFFFFFFFLPKQPKVNKEQLDFLEKNGIDPEVVFDAKGMLPSEYQIMEKEDKYIACNVIPCENGHTLKTLSNKCLQCKSPKDLKFWKRYYSEGYVYIAGSLNKEVIKIGFFEELECLESREESLNRTGYADTKDWIELLVLKKSKYAGRIESKTLSALKKDDFAFPIKYYHAGAWPESKETFKCSYSKALEYIEQVCSINGYDFSIIKEEPITKKYEFKNVKK